MVTKPVHVIAVAYDGHKPGGINISRGYLMFSSDKQHYGRQKPPYKNIRKKQYNSNQSDFKSMIHQNVV